MVVRIVTEKRIKEYAERHHDARSSLLNFVAKMRHSEFRDFAQLRQAFGSADQVIVASGRPVVIFKISGNRYRLIAAVHYNTGLVFVLEVMTHGEYDKARWKERL